MNPVKNPTPVDRTDLYLHLLTGWHVLLCLLFAAGVVIIWRSQTLASWVRILGTAVLLLGSIGSALSVPAIIQRKHRGRMISLAINYLGFLACFLYALHILGIFTGIDALAGTFGRGVPFMIGILVGYLISAFGDRYQNYPAKQMFYQRAGKFIMAIFGVVTLFFLGIVPGIIALLKRFDAPLPFILVFAEWLPVLIP